MSTDAAKSVTQNGRRAGSYGRSAAHRFTLIEILVSVALLAVVCFLVFKLFSRLQTAYSQSLRTTNTAENARLVFDVIARDLQMAVSCRDDIPGRSIEFHQPSEGSLWFVSSGEGLSQSSSGLLEVGYRFADFSVQRAYVDDTCSEWNVYGRRDDAHHQDGYHTVIDGVLDFRFICYGSRMIPYEPANADQLPYMVTMTLTLLDPQSFKRLRTATTERRTAIVRESARTFRKTVYLGGGGGSTS
jgi:type II secretion system protein J